MNEFSTNYSTFILHIKNVLPDETFIESIVNETFDEQLNRVKRFNDSLNTTTLFNYFLKNKIKLFSHKEKETLAISESIFGSEISLKKIFNNQDDSVKLLFWTDLKNLLLAYNKYILLNDSTNKNILERIQKLSDEVDVDEEVNSFNPKEGLNKILKTENLNATTNNMINDIFSTFEKSINQPGSNPFANIMEISQNISEKYKSNIENGEVNLDDLLSNMTGLPGMENIGEIIGSLTKQMQQTEEKPTEKVIIDENFSTAIVPKGEEKDESQNIDICGLLKTMDSLGLSNPFMGGKEPNDANKLMDVFGKLTKTSDPSQLNEIMEKDLGIDVTKFTEEMTKALNNND